MGSDANLKAMAPPFRLGCFYFAHFAYGGAFVAYLPLYLALPGLQPGEIPLGLALPEPGPRFPPLAMTLCALASLAAALGLPSRSAQAVPPATRLRFSPAAKALLAAGFCMAAAHGTLYTFLTLHLERAGYGGTVIGMLWTLGVLAEIAVFLYLPALFR